MYAAINGTKIFFDITGLQYVPDGPKMRKKPVCFLFHGGPGADHTNYLPELTALQDSMQLVFIDHRNSGLSEKGDISTSSLKQNAADADALRQYLGLDKIYVLGQSYGGMVAQQYALDYQENLYGLILTSTAPSYRFEITAPKIIMERGTPEQKELWQKKKAGQITDLQDYLVRMGSLYRHKWNDEIAEESKDSMLRSTMNTEVNNYQRSNELRKFDFVPRLHEIHCPTLILCGKHDFITTSEHSEEIHEHIPHSELHILEQSSHSLFCDEPELAFSYIDDFVKRNYID